MHKLSLDFNRCFWHGVMRVLNTDVRGLAERMEVEQRQVWRWLGGDARPQPIQFVRLVELLTDRRVDPRQGLPGAYQILSDESKQTRPILKRWAQTRDSHKEGCRVVALACWQRLGYALRSFQLVDFDRRLVDVSGTYRKPKARWHPEFGYLSPNPFELWLWPDPFAGALDQPDRPSMARFRQQAAQGREVERRRLSAGR